MEAICIIPARFHSTRFPGKLLVPIQGKTVLQRTFEQALLCPALTEVYVATDHELIAKHIEELGGKVIWTSPECQNGTMRLIDALQKEPHLQKVDVILNVQGDHPCTSPESMTAALHALEEDSSAVMSTLVTPLKDLSAFHSPHVVKCVFDLHQNALYFSRAPIPYCSQGIPENAYHHIGLYAYRTSFLLSFLGSSTTPLQQREDLEQLYVLEKGFTIKVAFTHDPPLAVDTPQDLVALEKHISALEL